jgi:hypothetical protein
VEQSLANACALLKPHGFLAMSVPFSPAGTTREHFAELHESGLARVGGSLALVNRTRTGEWHVFDNLVFHGGPGNALELRLFGEADLRRNLADAGFPRVEFAIAEYPPFGIAHRELWSLPLIAAKQPFHLSRDGMAELVRQYLILKYPKEDRGAKLERLKLEAELKRLQGEFAERTRWALDLDAEVKRRDTDALLWEAERKRLQDEVAARTRWALEVDAELKRRAEETARLYDQLNQEKFRGSQWEASRWTHLGRALGLGPKA